MGSAGRKGLFPSADLLNLAEELGCGCLIEARRFFQAQYANSLEQTQRAKSIGVCRIFRRLEGDLNVRLRREIVDLVRLRLLNDADDIGCIRDIAIVQMKCNALLVRVVNEVVYPFGVEGRRPALNAVNHITFAEQELGEIGAVLSGGAGDQSDLW